MTLDDITRIHDKLDSIVGTVHTIDTRLVRVESRLEDMPSGGEVTSRIDTAVERCAQQRGSEPPSRRPSVWDVGPGLRDLVKWVVAALVLGGSGTGIGYFFGQ